CYLPHLRRAVKSALLECERRLVESGALPTPAWTREDGNGDGREEVYVRTRELTLTLNPALGGAITELGYLGRDLDVGDVLARRPEIYHAEVRAGSRRDGGAGGKTIHDAPAPQEAGRGALGRPVEPGAHSGGRPGPVPDRDRPAIARQHRPRAGRGGRGPRRRMDWRTRAPRVGARRRARMGPGPDRVGVRGRLRADLPG